jgi:hypothetical protein
MHPYFTREPEPKGKLELQARDQQIIRLVHEHRFLTTPLLTLLLANHQGRPTKKALGMRLKKLFRHRFLDRPPKQWVLRVTDEEEGRYLIYALGREGAKWLSEKERVPIDQLRWTQKNHEVGEPHLKHALGITRFRIALTLALKNLPPASLLCWKHGEELKAKISLPDPKGQDQDFVLTPDGLLEIQKPDGKRSSFYLEYEHSTNLKRFLRAKGMAYRTYWHHPNYWKWEKREEGKKLVAVEKRFGFQGFRVLIIAGTERKKETLREIIQAWLKKENIKNAGMWLFTSEERYTLEHPESILGNIWQKATEDTELSLLDNPNQPTT